MMSGQIHPLASLPLVPIGYKTGWAPELVWYNDEEKNPPAPTCN